MVTSACCIPLCLHPVGLCLFPFSFITGFWKPLRRASFLTCNDLRPKNLLQGLGMRVTEGLSLPADLAGCRCPTIYDLAAKFPVSHSRYLPKEVELAFTYDRQNIISVQGFADVAISYSVLLHIMHRHTK